MTTQAKLVEVSLRESFISQTKERTGKNPSAKDWNAFYDNHPSEFPGGEIEYRKAMSHVTPIVKRALAYWQGRVNGERRIRSVETRPDTETRENPDFRAKLIKAVDEAGAEAQRNGVDLDG